MRLLFISPFVPGENAGHAGGVTTYHFVEGLARRGHEVHLLTLCREMEEPLLGPLRERLASVHPYSIPYRYDASVMRRLRHWLSLAGRVARGTFSRLPVYMVRYVYPELGRRAGELADRLHPDAVQIEYLVLAWVREHLSDRLPVVLDTHEVRTLTALRELEGQRGLRWLWHAREFAAWAEATSKLSGFSRALTVSDADALALRAFAPRLPVETLPQGVDCQVYRPCPGPRRPASLVFVGSFDHSQNLDAAQLLLDRVFPTVLAGLPEAQLHLVGNHPPTWLTQRAGGPIVVPGFVEDLPGYVGACEVFVAPLRRGAGIKIKLLQALALGLPVVTTPAGADGIGLEHRRTALIADDVEGCAELCLELLAEPALCRRLGQAGRELVEREFHRDRLVERLEVVLREVIGVEP